ncbi:MAG: Rieske 2Fe-2S domain-containing protein [Chloroflexi bacterium]|nr:Rieske 2Fe-2S domain-containing protein [Chloroflexota bacterium]
MKNSQEEQLVRVGPGTPSGELFRRYWLPIETTNNLGGRRGPTNLQGIGMNSPHAKNPIKVRVLGEDLILFRDASGKPGLLAEHCSHRGTSLLYGRVEEDCIRCLYHGWAYDRDGNVKDLPAEPEDSNLYRSVKQPAYPVIEVAGLIFAYLGPRDKMPVFPKYDVLYRTDGLRVTGDGSYVEECNVFQAMHDNNLDTWHVDILHVWYREMNNPNPFMGMHYGRDGRPPTPVRYDKTPWGTRDVVLKDTPQEGRYEYYELHTLWPSFRVNFAGGNSIKFATPIDDYNTRWFVVDFFPYDENGEIPPMAQRWITSTGPSINRGAGNLPKNWHEQVGGWWDFGHPWRQGVFWEDHVTQVSQNAKGRKLPDWDNWHLGSSDKGLVMNRRLWKEQIKRIQQGLDPIGVIRDPKLADQLIHVPADVAHVDWETGMKMFNQSPEARAAAVNAELGDRLYSAGLAGATGNGHSGNGHSGNGHAATNGNGAKARRGTVKVAATVPAPRKRSAATDPELMADGAEGEALDDR